MTTSTLPQPAGFIAQLDQLRSAHGIWFYSTAAYTLLAGLCLAAAAVDPRLFNGISVWVKPFKFYLSIAVYFATLIWFARWLPESYWKQASGRIMVAIPALAALFEMVYITVQAALGQASHFNVSTPFHATMYSLMGFGATSMVAVLVWMAFAIVRRHRFTDPMVAAIAIGLVLTFVLGGGFGGYLGSQAGHWVNAPATDAGGLMLFKWTTQGGDLRVAHFFGMHAMQALPLFALMIGKLLPRASSESLRFAYVIAFACAYSALSTATFLQAINGQPFIS